jgi:O-antigen ligase
MSVPIDTRQGLLLHGNRLRMAGAQASSALRDAVQVNLMVRVALYLYILSIPFEWPGRPIPVEIPTLTGAFFLLSTVLNPSACFRRVPAALVWFAAFLWAFVLAVVINRVEHHIPALQYFLNILEVVLLLWVIYNVLTDERALRGMLIGLVIACSVRALMQVLGIGVTVHEEWTGGVRMTVLGQNTNLSSMVLAGGMAVVIGLQVSADRRFPRFGLLTWPLAALMGLAIVQSGSRGGILCAGAGLAVYAISGRSFFARLRNAVFAIAAIAALGWAVYNSEMMRGRLTFAIEQRQLAGRERIYPAALNMIRERPVFGWGPIENQYEIAQRINFRKFPYRDTHNMMLELFTATGLVGGIPFLIGLGLSVRGAWRSRRGPLGVLPLAMLFAVLMGTVPGTWMAAKIVWLAMALSLAAGAHMAGAEAALPWSRAQRMTMLERVGA